jgi:hypothetical protein
MRCRSYILDFVALSLLLLFAMFFAYQFVNFDVPPLEDAAMLMRYVKHFAEGHGIVWNIGEPPVDGATDFLFMITVGLLVKAGMPLILATRFVGFTAHIMTVGIVYLTLRKLFDTPVLISMGTGLFLIVGPGFYYVAACFGTTYFTLAACVSWLFALLIIQKGEKRLSAILFAVTSLITGLIRPEGVFLTGCMLLAIIFVKGWANLRYTISFYFGVMLLVGGAYFLWRWDYFGYPLPNPYYKKGGGLLAPDSLKRSYFAVTVLCWPFIPAFIAGLLDRKTLRQTVGFLIPIVGFATLFILLVMEQSFLARYQYPVLPIALMAWWPLTEGVRQRLKIAAAGNMNKQRHIFYTVLVCAFFLLISKFQYDTWKFNYYYSGRYAAALILSEYQDKGLKLVASEAGLLPFYSQLTSLDPWGLNDQWIAHHGGITAEYLEKFNPDIIMFRAYFSPVASSLKNDAWDLMTLRLKDYAEKNGFILAAAYGETPYVTEYYYVRADFPESAELVGRIRAIKYYSETTGLELTNYAVGLP